MRKTVFYRVSGCVNAAGAPTSICMPATRLADLLPYAYGEKSTVNKAVRAASRDLGLHSNRDALGSALCTRSWSQAVTTRAFAKLTGAYDPARAAALARAEQEAAALAAENNAAWEQQAA